MVDVCACCGRPNTAESDPLVAACDVLVTRALELLGKRIVRADRSRFRRMDDRPWHQAHTLWQPDPLMVNKALSDAWTSVGDVLTEHGCCGVTCVDLTRMLDGYVRDLVLTMRGHAVEELRDRLAVYVDA